MSIGNAKFSPVVKWTGSKRSQMNEIVSRFPDKIETYYEPFCGSCAVLRCLIESGKIVKNYVCSDINKDLIDLWNTIKNSPKELSDYYEKLYNDMLNSCETPYDKSNFYNNIRSKFNGNHNPFDFMFIIRNSINGLIRYNPKGNFNASYHLGRNGIKPEKLKELIYEWSDILNENDVKFICQSYTEINPTENDFVYMDPPYANTGGMYFGGIDINDFFDFLRKLKCKYMFSFDGKTQKKDKTYDIPKDLYIKHEYLESGKSAFRKFVGDQSIVYESIYLNY